MVPQQVAWSGWRAAKFMGNVAEVAECVAGASQLVLKSWAEPKTADFGARAAYAERDMQNTSARIRPWRFYS